MSIEVVEVTTPAVTVVSVGGQPATGVVSTGGLTGPPGPAGPAGPQGPPGNSAATLGFSYNQPSSAALWQIVHPLPYAPAGIVVKDLAGTTIEYDNVTWPQPGVVELTFGAPVAGSVTLS